MYVRAAATKKIAANCPIFAGHWIKQHRQNHERNRFHLSRRYSNRSMRTMKMSSMWKRPIIHATKASASVQSRPTILAVRLHSCIQRHPSGIESSTPKNNFKRIRTQSIVKPKLDLVGELARDHLIRKTQSFSPAKRSALREPNFQRAVEPDATITEAIETVDPKSYNPARKVLNSLPKNSNGWSIRQPKRPFHKNRALTMSMDRESIPMLRQWPLQSTRRSSG